MGHTVSSPTSDLAEVFLTLFIPSETPSTAYHAQNEDQQYRSDERNQDRLQVGSRHRVTDMKEVESNPASQQTAEDANDNVTNYTVAPTPHDLSRQKSSNKANDNPGKYSHNNPPIVLSVFKEPQQKGLALLRVGNLDGRWFAAPPAFCLNDLVGKPANDSSGGEPQNELYKFNYFLLVLFL
jgi:hypothetical protein